MDRVTQLGLEAAERRSRVLKGVVVALIELGIADASQVFHVADLIAEQVGRATGHLEGAVETAGLHGTEVAAQTDEGIAGIQAAITGRAEQHLLLDLEERLQIRIDFMVALETQTRGVAANVQFGIILY